MKPAPFALATPTSVDEAIGCLTGSAGEARLLAGGQSLLPDMAMRIACPPVLVDLSRVAGLDHVTGGRDGSLAIGAMARQRAVERNPLVAARTPLLTMAIPHIAHVAIRNQGTVGGSIAQADPAAELPAVALAAAATMVIAGPSGERLVPADGFFAGETRASIAPDEVLTEIRFAGLSPGSGCGFAEFARRRGDVAIAGAAAVVGLAKGRFVSARIVAFGVGPTPLRVVDAERVVVGERPSAAVVAAAASAASASIDPRTDLHGSAEYRRHLAAVMVRRALDEAVTNSGRTP